MSYETFRTHADRFRSDSACDLLICDEAHRLKNDQCVVLLAAVPDHIPSSDPEHSVAAGH